MVAPGRTLTKSQKRELRSWLSKSGFDGRPELLLSNPEYAWAAWLDYQQSLGKPVPSLPAPAPIPVVASPVQRGKGQRGKAKVPAGELYSVRLPPDLLARYRDLAFREQRSVAQVIRLAMLAYLDRG